MGLSINKSKTKILTNSQNCIKIKIEKKELVDTDKMRYLGTVIEISRRKKNIE